MSLNANKSSLPTNKEIWQGANFLLAIAIFLSLFLSCFIGKWGLTDYKQEIFWPAIFTYLFAKLLSIRWLTIIWFCFLILVFNLPINYQFYFTGLILAIFLINQKTWPWWILAPIAVHAIGLLSFGNDFTIYKFEFLTKHSLFFEMIMIYPLSFLGFIISRLLDWFRYLEAA